jgi:1-acyl-sn-glycerol-3-phosphate acyltransferase
MHRQPLVDQFPYRFYPPKFGRFWWHAGRVYNTYQYLRREQKVVGLDIQGSEHLGPLLGRGDGVLIAPNHPDSADPGVIYEASHRVGRQFAFLAGYQLFGGMARHVLPRVGAFPIDREGTDLRAFKAGVEVLVQARHPLVIFPEGEIYRTSDRLTPIREGVAAFASTASKRLADRGKTVWLVPTAVKYRFLEEVDPLPSLVEAMDRLELRFTWWPRSDLPIVDRIYAYAEGLLALKELELLGAARQGPIKERIATLRDSILDRIEDKRAGKRRVDTVPVRIKELRRVCLEALTGPGVAPELASELRRDLNDIFVALQLFSYPGDYVRAEPTLERIAETLLKFEQDLFGDEAALPRGRRRAIVRFGEPIDVGKRLAELGKPRVANPRIAAELEEGIQGLLDAIGPGRPIPDSRRSPAARAELAGR